MPKAPNRRKIAKPDAVPTVFALPDRDKSEALAPLNFKVAAQFRREFKLYALQNGISMVHLLKESFRVLKKSRGA